jgi:hypothetical protein
VATTLVEVHPEESLFAAHVRPHQVLGEGGLHPGETLPHGLGSRTRRERLSLAGPAEERRNACHEFAQICRLTCLTCQVVGSVLEHLLQLVEHRPERPLTHLGDLPHTHLLPIFPLQLPAEALQLLRPLTLCW